LHGKSRYNFEKLPAFLKTEEIGRENDGSLIAILDKNRKPFIFLARIWENPPV
tara:strand:+ start:2087 stop:2245 length:159 start_codon:yes stop_codon:yes gene_type:complete